MLRYSLHRLFTGVVVFFSVTLLTFFLFHSRGSVAIAANLLEPDATTAQIQERAEDLGLNRSVVVQYFEWLGGLFSGDFGTSFVSGLPISQVMATRIPVTVSIVVVSLVLSVFASVALGVGASTRGGAVDRALQVLTIVVRAIPGFWVALVLVIIFGLTLRLLPATGYIPLSTSFGGWLSSVILPSVAIALGNIAAIGAQLRGSMLDVMRQDYIRTLRSRSLSRRALIYRHALRNAAPAGLTMLSLEVISTFSGAIVVERIFALPGLGQLTLTAGKAGDIPVVLGIVAFMVVVVVGVNLVVDILNGFLTPKARAQ